MIKICFYFKDERQNIYEGVLKRSQPNQEWNDLKLLNVIPYIHPTGEHTSYHLSSFFNP